MKLILMQFLSLDGVSQGPGAPDEDTSDGFASGGWFVPHLDEHFQQTIVTWIEEADAFLFGRRTYTSFARDWPPMDDPDDPVASRLNHLPKYVATTTLTEAGWAPTTILSGDVMAQVADLKAQPGRELQVHGSSRLGQSLLAAGLVDELRLVVAPVVVGSGRRLFPDGGAPAAFRLVRNDSTPGGLTVLVYEAAGAPTFGTYGAAERAG